MGDFTKDSEIPGDVFVYPGEIFCRAKWNKEDKELCNVDIPYITFRTISNSIQVKVAERGSLITHLKRQHPSYQPIPRKYGRGGTREDRIAIQFFERILNPPLPPTKHHPILVRSRSSSPRPHSTNTQLAESVAEAERQLQALRALLTQAEQASNTIQKDPAKGRKRKRVQFVDRPDDKEVVTESNSPPIVPVKVPRYKSGNKKMGMKKGQVCIQLNHHSNMF